MRTNFQMIMELKNYSPKEDGVTSWSEIKMIRNHFNLCDMSRLELQNLRDMVVLLYGNWTREAREKSNWSEFDAKHNAMCSITAVIDMLICANC